MKPKISVIICCANAQKTLSAACESIQWADELIIVDSGSTDQTPEIAKIYATRYIAEPWRGYTEQKQFAITLCANDWVLIVDSDEEIPSSLTREIQNLSQQQFDQHDMFHVRRKNYVMGKHVRAWDPDWIARLVHRQRVQWQDHALHNTCYATDTKREGRLKGHFLHKRVGKPDYSDYFCGKRMDERLLLVAREMYQRGKRCHWWDLLLRPALAFLKFYFIKGGLFSGSFGLLMAQKASVSTQLKYAALWYVQKFEAK